MSVTSLSAFTLLFAVVVVAGCAAAAASSEPVEFPKQFVVSTGSTIPFENDVDPVAQSGAIFFDEPSGRVRIDTFWMGNRRSFVADINKQRGYLINNAECITSHLKGALKPVAVPKGAVFDPETNIVRSVKVKHWEATERAEEGPLSVDYYVRRVNLTADDGTPLSYWFPWRVSSRKTKRGELAPPPNDEGNRNWRFFGEPVMDEIIRYASSRGAPESGLHGITEGVVVTMDFYNFVPMVPDPAVFEIPAQCVEPATQEYERDIDVMETQRHLMTLTFNNEEGKRLLDSLYRSRKAIKAREDL